MKVAFAIPVYRHGRPLANVVRGLIPYAIPIIVVDDGNEGEERDLVQSVASLSALVKVIRLKKNMGKGAAVNVAARTACEMGMTHLFQLDADGQHDISSCSRFLAAAEETPHAIICGYPIYDESVPDIRRKGREFSNGWVRFVTLNHEIKDSLCGFRIYPLESYARILGGHSILSRRMGYDVDILVQMLWQGLPIVNMGVHVTYPEDGISNFRMFHDNLDISLTYTRLCAGMLIRLPLLAWRSWKRRHP